MQPREIPSWDAYFLALAQQVSTRSKDPHTQVGCAIVGPEPGREVRSLGYNGFPRKVNDRDWLRWDRPTKYSFVVHGEMNAILNAARNGIQLLGCALYCTLPPCVGCAKAIIQSGIDRVVVPAHELQKLRNPNFLEQLEWVDWRKDFVIADIMFEEAGVKLVGF